MALPVDTAKFRFRENGLKIRAARRLTGLSQENFAKEIGTGRRHMIKLENGEHRPSGRLRDRIIEVTGTEEQIEASDDEDEDALDRDLWTVVSRYRLPQKPRMSMEGWLLMQHTPVSPQDAVRKRRDALHEIRHSYELERFLSA